MLTYRLLLVLGMSLTTTIATLDADEVPQADTDLANRLAALVNKVKASSKVDERRRLVLDLAKVQDEHEFPIDDQTTKLLADAADLLSSERRSIEEQLRTTSSESLRLKLVQMLGSIHHNESVPLLAGTLATDESLHVRVEAASALAKYKSADVVEHLITATADPNVSIKCSALKSLGEIGKAAESAIPVVLAAFSDTRHVAVAITRDAYTRERVSSFAIEAAGRIGIASNEVISRVEEVLHGSDAPIIRVACIKALCQLDPANSVIDEEFKSLRSEKSSRVRYQAVMVLRHRALNGYPSAALNELEKYSHDESRLVRAGVARTLGLIGNAERGSLNMLADLIADELWLVRENALRSAKQLGRRARPLISEVTAAARTPLVGVGEESVQMMAIDAIVAISNLSEAESALQELITSAEHSASVQNHIHETLARLRTLENEQLE